MGNLEFKDINVALLAFKHFKKERQDQIRSSIKASVRSIFGVHPETSGKKMDRNLLKVEEEYWNVSWSRFYQYHSGAVEISDWVSEIGTEMYLLSLVAEDQKGSYGLLKNFYNKYLFGYIRSLTRKIYSDQTLIVQKSEEISEKTIFLVLKNIDRYSPYKAGFIAWSYSIARNVLRTPDERAYESTDLTLDYELQSDSDGGLIDRIASEDQPPDEAYAQGELGRIVLETLFDNCGYPWQVLSVGLMKIDYQPSEIVAKFSESTLREIFFDFVEEFSKASFRAEEELMKMMKPLSDSLDQKVSTVISSVDTKTRIKMQARLEEKCSDMALKVFFGKLPNKNISDWNIRVMMRLRKRLEENGIF